MPLALKRRCKSEILSTDCITLKLFVVEALLQPTGKASAFPTPLGEKRQKETDFRGKNKKKNGKEKVEVNEEENQIVPRTRLIRALQSLVVRSRNCKYVSSFSECMYIGLILWLIVGNHSQSSQRPRQWLLCGRYLTTYSLKLHVAIVNERLK